MDDTPQYAYEPGDRVIAICWRGSGDPKPDNSHRVWEVRVLEAVKHQNGRLTWEKSYGPGTVFYGDFSHIDTAKQMVKRIKKDVPYLISADIGRPVRSLEDEVIEALKEL